MHSPSLPKSLRRKSLVSSIESLESRIAPAAFVVTSLADSGAGTLRDAITKANAQAGADKITFAPALSGQINLGSEIGITDIVSITAKNNITLSGGGAVRIFNIDDGNFMTDKPVTLTGLAFLNGKATGAGAAGAGGAVISQESLTISNCIFAGNTAATLGGALEVNNSSTVTIKNSTFLGNTANVAGAMHSFSTKSTTLTNNVVQGNTGTSSAGGIYIENSASDTKITITGGQISNNVGGANLFRAGGLSIEGLTTGLAKTTISNVLIQGNTGGGFQALAADVTLSNVTISHNTSSNAGAGMVLDLDVSSLKVTNSIIAHNVTTSPIGGGGVALKDVTKASFTNTQFLGNSALAPGMAGPGAAGGGLAAGLTPAAGPNSGTALSIVSCTFSDNESASNGGGGLFTTGTGAAGVALTVSKSKFLGNSTTGDGGGLFTVGSGAVSITSSTFSGNSADIGGGGLSVISAGAIKFASLTVTGNVGATTGGAEIAGPTSKTVTITGGLYAFNQGDAQGTGGLSLANNNASTVISGITVTQNVGGQMNGAGGLSYFGSTPITLVKSKVFGNLHLSVPANADKVGPIS